MGIPYFDLLFAARERGEPAARLFERFVHWGYWPEPRLADGTLADFTAAMERLNDQVLEAAALADGQAVLDAGCGFGGTLAAVDARYARMRLTGVNIEGRQLEVARRTVRPREGSSLEFVEADACALPFADASFDRVLAVECIFHFPSRLAFLKEARRVLKPGGRAALSDFVPARLGGRGPLGAWIEGKVARDYGSYSHWNDGGYGEMAEKAGLRLALDRDITRETLPTYPVVLREAPQLATGTRILQWASRLGFVRYRVVSFEKP